MSTTLLIHVDAERGTARVLRQPLGIMTETERVTLRQAREAAGLTQAEAARLAGCSRTHWAQLEHGATPGHSVSVGLARAMCAVLHRHIDNVEEFAAPSARPPAEGADEQ